MQSRPTSLYQKILLARYTDLPKAVQAFHRFGAPVRWEGVAEVRRGTSIISRLIAGTFGFPAAGRDVAVVVTVLQETDFELWTRNFNGKTFESRQSSREGKLVERFGPVTVTIDLVVKDRRMFLVPTSWTCFGIPFPSGLLPKGQSFEAEFEDGFLFDVTIEAPLFGLIVAYRGRLHPA